jgi:hypothetical protein
MFKKLLLLTAVLVLAFAVTSTAKDLTGRFGLGYYESDAPVGIRYWVNEKIGIDAGIGFQSVDGIIQEEWNNSGDYTADTVSATQFVFSVGVPYVVYPTERANFMVRPGLLFKSNDKKFKDEEEIREKLGIEGESQIYITLHLVGEVFFGDHFSLEAAHGFNVGMISPFGDGDSKMNFGSASGSITQLGFHFYF